MGGGGLLTLGKEPMYTTVVPWSQDLRHMYTSMQLSGKYPKHIVGNTAITPVGYWDGGRGGDVKC